MGKSKFLSKEEVRELIKKSHAGDMDARELIVEKNMKLVWNVVHRFINRGYLPEDLFQIGCIGLLRSIDKFNLDYDVQFSTYAVPMIIGEIQRFIRDDGTVKVPRSIKELANKIRYAGLVKEEPAAIIKALELGDVSEEYIKLAVKYIKENGGKPLSTEETVYENDGDPITIGDQMSGDINGSNWLDSIALRQAIDVLDDREKTIVYLRYYQDKTQAETAETLGVSQVQVSRLEKKIVAKMKDGFNKEGKEVVKPTPEVTKMVVAVGEPKKQVKRESVVMGKHKEVVGNREEAVRLLKETEMSAQEIINLTGVPKGSMAALVKKHRSEEKNKRIVARSRKARGNNKGKDKKPKAAKVKQTAAKQKPVAVKYNDKERKALQPLSNVPPTGDTYVLGDSEMSPAMKRMEEQGKQLVEHMIRVQAKGMADYVKKMDRGPIQPVTQIGPHKIGYHPEGISITMGEVEEPKAKVEYNFNFNVSGKQVSIDEVITKLEELKTMLSHIPVDAVNFRINVGS